MTVFVVDDDADHLAALCDLIEVGGHTATGFLQAEHAIEAARKNPPKAILTDLRMPGMDGMALTEAVTDMAADIPVIMLTGHGDVAAAVKAIQAGAEDFLEKPYDAQHLLSVLNRTLRAQATRAELARLQTELAQQADTILGENAALVALRDQLSALAPLNVDVILTGETGTGKELCARILHTASPRTTGPYVALNCAALPESLFEFEVFGHAAAAFPGALEKPGKLESANGGTLVLDEIEAMPLPVQAKLLRALQERQVERLGENQLRPLDLRIITTAKTDLRQAITEGRFRADLFYRLNGAELHLPPLRGLGPDIALIFAHYATLAARLYGRTAPDISISLRRDLQRHDWPGNIRELKTAAERLALGLGPSLPQNAQAETLPERVAAYEAREIAAALDRFNQSVERAAQSLGIPRRTLADKMARYGIKG
ncbi:sigma-54-dependent transcriptional regulator [Pseudorhodobacter sp. W20_MBD10_FR17]|uniref:sigma-54-dependent transcriptional regulator n=1 Tax=Pseudorhodobacter sp. W20_MBD10_FR17 TaxID=3240266 RepID=UPI003F9D0331